MTPSERASVKALQEAMRIGPACIGVLFNWNALALALDAFAADAVRAERERMGMIAADYFSEDIDGLGVLELIEMAKEIERRANTGYVTRLEREADEWAKQYRARTPASGEKK